MPIAEAGVTSLLWAVLRMVAAVGLLGAAAWVLLRWKRRATRGPEALNVLDRACLTRGASIALVSVAGRRLLLGVSSDGVRLLSDLEAGAPPDGPADFDLALRDVVERDEAPR